MLTPSAEAPRFQRASDQSLLIYFGQHITMQAHEHVRRLLRLLELQPIPGVRNLHPALQNVRLSHRWGGPILIADKWQPVFRRHAEYRDVIVLGAYSGHGVALSVYLGAWAAEAMLGKKDLPQWDDEASAVD